jgi:23S rRNA pseudouridine1911/1915/1917 synthase
VNQGFEYRERIDRRAASLTVLAYLSRRYRHSSEAVWRERLERGEVLLDDRPARPGAILRPGLSLVWRRPSWREPGAPLAFAVLYADRHLLAVAKPAGLPTLPGGGFLEHTLLALVRARYPEACPVHRLGRGTSGIVLFALSAPARAGLAAAWRDRRVLKVYRALARGVPATRSFPVEVPIGPVPHPRLGSVHAAAAHGKAAISRVAVLEDRRDASLLEVRIDTGRPHQIRIHLAAAGHPLIGDPFYRSGGVPRDDGGGRPGDTGYALHARRLALLHPISQRPIDVECRPPHVLRMATEP